MEHLLALLKSDELRSMIRGMSESQLISYKERVKSIRLSLVMLVKDQVNQVSETLASFSKLAIDEVVVVDTGSTDGTVQRLYALSDVIVHEVAWVEDYAEMRNRASSFASGDWVLIVDADEPLVTQSVDLKGLIGALSEVVNFPFAISFKQILADKGHYGEPLRVYKKSDGYFYGLVHEELRDGSTAIPIVTIATNITVKNSGTSELEMARFDKVNRYRDLLAIMMHREPDNPRWFVMQDKPYDLSGAKDQYEHLIKRYLCIADTRPVSQENVKLTGYEQQLFLLYIAFLMADKRYYEAGELVKVALALFPKDITLHFYQVRAILERIEDRHLHQLWQLFRSR